VSGRKRAIWLAAVATPVFFALLVPLQNRIEAKTASVEEQKEELLFRSAATLKKMSLGYNSLLADIYWTRAIQYYGESIRSADPQFQLLAPLLDLATSLDPRLMPAYQFGAILLSEPQPVGAGQPELAAALVRKGIGVNPDNWSLWADLGFVYYWHMEDYAGAADAFLSGSKCPGAPPWMKPMAARVAAQGGSIELSFAIWQQVYDSTQNVRIRSNALKHLQALKAEQDIHYLNGLAAEYRMFFGHYPASFSDIQAAKVIRSIPRDPRGTPYVIGLGGQVHLGASSSIDLGLITSQATPREKKQAP
jgi:hypothetical protein